MGDTDRFWAGIIIGAPAALAAVWLLLLWPARARWEKASLVIPLLLSPVLLYLYFPVAMSAGIAGHHLCGPEFDHYRSYASRWERLIPFLHVVLTASILLATVGNYWRGRRIA
jgi:hypothetical protein